MNDLIDDLILEFNSITLESEKIKVNTFIDHVSKKKLDDENINSLISEFMQLDMEKKPHIVTKFYEFILKCINIDRKYINSEIFVPPEPPLCR